MLREKPPILEECKDCPRHRRDMVLGCGSKRLGILFIGEAPGAEEVKEGRPFVGRAGRMLTKFCNHLKIPREFTFITNSILCRPPGNAKPTGDEIACCSHRLHLTIKRLSPKLIVILGSIAAEAVLKEKSPIYKLRGKMIKYNKYRSDLKAIVLYHPSYHARSNELFLAADEKIMRQAMELCGLSR